MTEVMLNDKCMHCNNRECHDGYNFCNQAMKDNSFYKNAKLYKGLEVIKRPTYEELEKENAGLKCECRRCVYTDSPCILSDYGKDKNGICDHFKDVFDAIAELKDFYENEYFQIADRTADENIKELEKYQVEATVDDYSPYDPNTWGDMHEEWFVPKEAVRDLLKENYALITKAKVCLEQLVSEITVGELEIDPNVLQQAENFLKEKN